MYGGRIDVCEHLKSKGLLDLIEDVGLSSDRDTPLQICIWETEDEKTARWLVDNGADIGKLDSEDFKGACRFFCPSFVEELAGKVPPAHLTMRTGEDESPMQAAFCCNHEETSIVRMFILRGVPALAEDFPEWKYMGDGTFHNDLRPYRREILASFEADLALNDRTFLGLFLAGGVHAPNTNPSDTSGATVTTTTKRVRTQRSNGSWSAPITVPCEPRLVAAPTPTGQGQGGARAATWLENHLPKLRGFRNTEVRMEIAGFLGVRSALDLQRLRAARDVFGGVQSGGLRGGVRRTGHGVASVARPCSGPWLSVRAPAW